MCHPDSPNRCISHRPAPILTTATTTTAITTDARHPRAQPPSFTIISIIPDTTSAATTVTTIAPTSAVDQNALNGPQTPTPVIAISSDVDSVLTCPQCDSTLRSRIGLVGHLRIHRNASGAPVPGSPAYTLSIHPHFHATNAHSYTA
nr:unnamed protein product [Spirometra erinaceieuropaei]